MSTLTLYQGTASFTNGSATVTGTDESWSSLLPGEPMEGPDGKWYEITPVDDNTLTLDRPYEGSTTESGDYTIFRTGVGHDSVRMATKQLSEIAATYRRIISLTVDDQLVTLNRHEENDLAGVILQQDEVDQFRVGMFGNKKFSIQYLLEAAWSNAFGVDPENGAVEILSQFLLGGTLTPGQLTADVDDYNPTGFDQANVLRINQDAQHRLNGLAGGAKGRIVAILNISNFNLVIPHEAETSTAKNRFVTDGNAVAIPPKQMALFFWDDGTERWHFMTSSGAGGAGDPDVKSALEFVIDGGGSNIVPGFKGYLDVPFACTIQKATLTSYQQGSIVVDIWRIPASDLPGALPGNVSNSICGLARPTLSNAYYSQDSTLNGWSKELSEGDKLGFNVVSASGVRQVTLGLPVQKILSGS